MTIKTKLLLSLCSIALILMSGCVKKCGDCPSGSTLVVDKPKDDECWCCKSGSHWCPEAQTCCPDGYNYTDGVACYDWLGYMSSSCVGCYSCN